MNFIRENLSSLMFLAGMLLLVMLMLRRNWRARRQTSKQRKQNSKYLIESARQTDKEWTMSDGSKEVQRWQAELLNFTREQAAELKTKIVYLEQAIAIARKEQQTLEQQTRNGTHPEAEKALAQLEQAIRESEAFDASRVPPSELITEVLCNDNVRAQIYGLAEEGKTIDEISEATTVDAAAVEMIVHLRKPLN